MKLASKLTTIPISRIAISLDFPTPEMEDRFRGRTGAFDMAMAGIENARKAGVEIQINCTITKMNFHLLGELVDLALKVGAVAFHPFLLVPTGRGKGLEAVELSPDEYEQALNKIYDMQVELGDRLFFKPTDAPHYMRVVSQRQRKEPVTEFGPHPFPLSSITPHCWPPRWKSQWNDQRVLGGGRILFYFPHWKGPGLWISDRGGWGSKTAVIRRGVERFTRVQRPAEPGKHQRQVRNL